jgi:hypothetical protein
MISTSCLHTRQSPHRRFCVICKGGKRRAFKVKGDANEVQTKHKLRSGPWPTILHLICVSAFPSLFLMTEFRGRVASILHNHDRLASNLDPNADHHQTTTTCLDNHTYVSDLTQVLTENMLIMLGLNRPTGSLGQKYVID